MRKIFLAFLCAISFASAQDVLTQRHLEFFTHTLAERFLKDSPLPAGEKLEVALIYNLTDEKELDFQKALKIFIESSKLTPAKSSKYQLMFVLTKELGAIYQYKPRVMDWIYQANIIIYDTKAKKILWDKTYPYIWRGEHEGKPED